MYDILPKPRQNDAPIKTVSKRINEVLAGTPTRPFGLYDFLITITATFWYFFFTGLAILFKREVPARWLSLAYKLDGGNVAKNIKKTTSKPEPKKASIKVEDINKAKPVEIRV